MAIPTIQRKQTNKAKKSVSKKTKPKKGSLEAIHKAFDELRRHNVDLTYIMTNS